MATLYIRRAIIIVPSADQSGANTYFKNNIDTIGGDQTFMSELSSDGETPVTHYFCDGRFIQSEWDIIVGDFSTTYPDAVVYVGENEHDVSPDTKYSQDAAITDAGLQRIEDTSPM